MTRPTHDEQRPRTRANHDESGGTAARRARRLLRALTARPRLLSSVAVGIVVFLALPGLPSLHLAARALVAWNAGAGLYLLLVFRMIRGDGVEGIRRRALRQDDGRIAVLVLTVASALAVLLAVGSQLATVKDLHGVPRAAHILLAALTVVSSWSFTQALFALHYAHEFHLARVRGQPDPLSFPGTAEPLYRDFVYFACVIGTSGQTADVSFSGSSLRGVGTVHCVLAYFFNATLLALAINIAAGLL
jgi:uncharacterized membrane protein